jgi:hypothetical protein
MPRSSGSIRFESAEKKWPGICRERSHVPWQLNLRGTRDSGRVAGRFRSKASVATSSSSPVAPSSSSLAAPSSSSLAAPSSSSLAAPSSSLLAAPSSSPHVRRGLSRTRRLLCTHYEPAFCHRRSCRSEKLSRFPKLERRVNRVG